MRSGALRYLVLLLLMALIAACGGGADGAGDTTTTGTPDTTAAPATTAPDDDDDDDDDGGFPSGVCLEASQAMAAATSSYAQAFTGIFDEATAEAIEAQLEAMADAAPDEIRDDFEVFAREMSGFYRVMAEIGLTPGATPTADQLQALSEAADSVDQDALDEASDNITAWFEANC
jgi:hypothetical protein